MIRYGALLSVIRRGDDGEPVLVLEQIISGQRHRVFVDRSGAQGLLKALQFCFWNQRQETITVSPGTPALEYPELVGEIENGPIP